MARYVYWKGFDLNSEPVDGMYEIAGMGEKVVRLWMCGHRCAWVELMRSAYDGRVERGEIVEVDYEATAIHLPPEEHMEMTMSIIAHGEILLSWRDTQTQKTVTLHMYQGQLDMIQETIRKGLHCAFYAQEMSRY